MATTSSRWQPEGLRREPVGSSTPLLRALRGDPNNFGLPSDHAAHLPGVGPSPPTPRAADQHPRDRRPPSTRRILDPWRTRSPRPPPARGARPAHPPARLRPPPRGGRHRVGPALPRDRRRAVRGEAHRPAALHDDLRLPDLPRPRHPHELRLGLVGRSAGSDPRHRRGGEPRHPRRQEPGGMVPGAEDRRGGGGARLHAGERVRGVHGANRVHHPASTPTSCSTRTCSASRLPGSRDRRSISPSWPARSFTSEGSREPRSSIP